MFVAGWLRLPFAVAGTLLVGAALASLVRRRRAAAHVAPLGPLLLPVVAIAAVWVVCAGVGHWVYTNQDWVVRDAVLRDLAVDPWPVHYAVDGVDTLLRAPIGYFLPAALVGKVAGLRAADVALFAWTVTGVAIVFALMLADRPPLSRALVRIAVFVVFSGMDVVGTKMRYHPIELGTHLEWWAFLFQYSSNTTLLFWVPNHALPGWIAAAWLCTRGDRRHPTIAILFVVLAPLWSPLTAIGIAPFALVAAARSLARRFDWRPLADWRMLAVTLVSLALVYPYLVAGGDRVASGGGASLRWVGEEFGARYVEFLVFECAGFVVLLLRRDRKDVWVWTAAIVLALLPLYRFGPYNDLAMRGSIASLAVLAIRLGDWLSTRMVFSRDGVGRIAAVVLLAVGAVTPFMEFARAFVNPARPLDPSASVVDVTRGTHYLTEADRPWPRRFLRQPQP